MHVRRIARVAARAAAALALVAAACRPHTAPITTVDGAFAIAVAGSEWSLLELDARPVPGGAGGKRPTIQFESASGRASGFTGCNDFRAGYELSHDTLRFSPPAMTRMACTVGMDLERRFLAALVATRRYRIADGDLLLESEDGAVARFTRGGN